jgi:plastocyanin
MWLCRTRALFAMLAAIVAASTPAGASARAGAADCPGMDANIAPVPGEPGAYFVTTRHHTTIARVPGPKPAATGALYTIQALDMTFDSDGNAGTVHDTLVVPVGSTVRWQLVTGIHTLTNGRDDSDPQAGTKFNYLLTSGFDHFDSTFTAPTQLDFYCEFHLPDMTGTLIVRNTTDAPPGPLAGALGFSRPPTPDPSAGPVRFALSVPSPTRVRVEVFDIAGRRMAVIADGVLTAGEHPMSWDARSAAGPAPPGRYRVRWVAGDREQSLGFSLTR